ncbi:MAG TPA: hypothetical protein VIF62_20320, partial [Labilithrix sp.]
EVEGDLERAELLRGRDNALFRDFLQDVTDSCHVAVTPRDFLGYCVALSGLRSRESSVRIRPGVPKSLWKNFRGAAFCHRGDLSGDGERIEVIGAPRGVRLSPRRRRSGPCRRRRRT